MIKSLWYSLIKDVPFWEIVLLNLLRRSSFSSVSSHRKSCLQAFTKPRKAVVKGFRKGTRSALRSSFSVFNLSSVRVSKSLICSSLCFLRSSSEFRDRR